MTRIVNFPIRHPRASGAPRVPANGNHEIRGSVSMGTFLAQSERSDDPAVAVALGVRYGAMNAVEVTGAPVSVRNDLRRHAAAGSAAAQRTLDWLDRQLLAAVEDLEAGQ